MALLAFITLSVVTRAGRGPSTLPGQRGIKTQLVQLCQTAHAEDTEQKLVDDFDQLIRQLSDDAPRRRHPAVPERWACSSDSACEKSFSRPGRSRSHKFKKTQVARRPRPRRGARRRGLRRRLAGRAGRERRRRARLRRRRRRRGDGGAAPLSPEDGTGRLDVHAPLAAPACRAAGAAAGGGALPRRRLRGPARRLHGLRRRRVADGSDERAAAHTRVIDYYHPAPPVL